jgi:EAL domain-containing protein (putative c-di-GMP-specific phosphodiesterase class I)
MQTYPLLNAAINMCPTLLDHAMAQEILNIVKQADLSPDRLTLELTEYYPPSDMAELARVVAFLRKSGVRIALDDFGTGHATMAYLAHVDLDEVKIDKSLIQGIGESTIMRQELATILDLISVSGARVTCEGVETQEDALALKNMGVEQIQGYFFAKPSFLSHIFPL